MEANDDTGRGNWVGGWLHVHEELLIAAVEVYWTTTSKKLKVMYNSLATVLICFIVSSHPNPESNRQFGRFNLSALWLMYVKHNALVFIPDSAIFVRG